MAPHTEYTEEFSVFQETVEINSTFNGRKINLSKKIIVPYLFLMCKTVDWPVTAGFGLCRRFFGKGEVREGYRET
jgi:hypothetical protein